MISFKSKFSITMVGCVLLMIILIFSSCVFWPTNWGPTVTKNYDYKDFNNVDVSSTFIVEIVQSDTYSIAITAQESMFNYLDISVSASTLKIGLKPFTFGGNVRPKARISLPEIYNLSLSGACEGNVSGFKVKHDIVIKISGASSLVIDGEAEIAKIAVSGASKVDGTLKASSAEIELSGASKLTLSGDANNMKLNVSAASRAELADFQIQKAEINMSAASRAFVNVVDSIDVDISAASTLEYSGNPKFNKLNISGASNLQKK